jgi:DNA polymerase III delta prime subunit
MEFWELDVIYKIQNWKWRQKPLLLIGPTGIGKTTAAEKLLAGRDIIRFYPINFHDTKNFIQQLDDALKHTSILQMMRTGLPKAVLIENTDEMTTSEKTLLKYLAEVKNPSCPLILTARKPEKRHRELIRSCHSIKILRLDPACASLTTDQKKLVKAGETNIRSLFRNDSSIVRESEDISLLASQILSCKVHSIPNTVSLTEKSILVNTLIENLSNRLEEWICVAADRVLSRIFKEERWDLVKFLDNHILPLILEELKTNGPVKKPTFSMMLSHTSTRALNRKSIVSIYNEMYDDPIITLRKYINYLPDRFRSKPLFQNEKDLYSPQIIGEIHSSATSLPLRHPHLEDSWSLNKGVSTYHEEITGEDDDDEEAAAAASAPLSSPTPE